MGDGTRKTWFVLGSNGSQCNPVGIIALEAYFMWTVAYAIGALKYAIKRVIRPTR